MQQGRINAAHIIGCMRFASFMVRGTDEFEKCMRSVPFMVGRRAFTT